MPLAHLQYQEGNHNSQLPPSLLGSSQVRPQSWIHCRTGMACRGPSPLALARASRYSWLPGRYFPGSEGGLRPPSEPWAPECLGLARDFGSLWRKLVNMKLVPWCSNSRMDERMPGLRRVFHDPCYTWSVWYEVIWNSEHEVRQGKRSQKFGTRTEREVR